MVLLFLEWHYGPSCICFHLSLFPHRLSRFDGCLFFILQPPSRKLSHCFTISTFTEISYLGNKIALLSLNINTKYIKFQTDTRSWPAGEPLPRDYPMNAGIWCSSLPGLAQPKTSHLSINHIWACFLLKTTMACEVSPNDAMSFGSGMFFSYSFFFQ